MSIPIFVAHENELLRLQQFLNQVKAGQGQVAFVAGEAGAGKTALIYEFVRRAQGSDDHVIAAIGQCNAQTGAGDPYLPFREVLSTLTDDSSDSQPGNTISTTNAARLRSFARISANTLIDIAPDLIGVFIPGSSILVKALSKAADNSNLKGKLTQHLGKSTIDAETSITSELDQEKIFQQYARALKVLSADHPLIVILDDLQWADSASINLLFHLSRQLLDSRVLLLGAYRPVDVALGRGGERHPLDPVLNELRRYQGDIVVDMDQARVGEGRAFVDALIDAQPNQLNAAFRQELFARTDGHPLFTVEMLRNLQERGNLVKDAQGRWIEDETLDWDALPARVDGVIEERMARLEDDLRETLNIASVVGSQFAAQVVAQVQQAQERELLRQLSRNLEKRHHLVHEMGEIKVGPRFLSQYSFSHAIFQQFLYNDLSAGERRILHGDVAEALESSYMGYTDTIAVQLARHFIEAGADDKAAEYHIRAGDESRRVFAAAEARLHYLDALSLLQNLPETIDTRRQRFYTMLKYATLALGGDNPYKLLAHLLEAESLGKSLLEAKQDSDLVSLAQLRLELAKIHYTLNQPIEAFACCEQVLSDANELGDGGLGTWASGMIGIGKLDQGEFAQAIKLLSPAVSYLEQAQNWREWAWMKMNLAFGLAGHGEASAALEHAEQTKDQALKMKDVWMICVVHLYLAHSYWAAGDIAQMLAEARTLVEIAEQHQEMNFVQLGMLPLMWAESKLGDHDAAAHTMELRQEVIERAGVEIVWADWAAAARAEMALNAGRAQDALALSEHAVTVAQSVGGKLAEGIAQRTWAEALAISAQPAFVEVEQHLAASMQLFEEGAARAEVARTYLVWGKLYHTHGPAASARQYLKKAAEQLDALGMEFELKVAHTLLYE